MLWQGSCVGRGAGRGGVQQGRRNRAGGSGAGLTCSVSSSRRGRVPGLGRGAVPANSSVRQIQRVLMRRCGVCTSTFDTATPLVQVQVNAHRHKSQLQHSCSIFLAHESGTCAGMDWPAESGVESVREQGRAGATYHAEDRGNLQRRGALHGRCVERVRN